VLLDGSLREVEEERRERASAVADVLEADLGDDPLHAIREALRGAQVASGSLSVDRLDAAAARELVLLGERFERLGHSLKVTAAARVEATAAWRGDGDRSIADWMARTTGTSKHDAQRNVQTGKRLRSLPKVEKALRSGRVSPKQAEAIADASEADPGAEEELIAEAGRTSLNEFKQRCRERRAKADPDPEATAKRIHAKRSCRTWTEPDGTAHLHLSGPGSTIARIDAAIRHRADHLFREANREGRQEPTGAYAFDAAAALLLRDGDGTPVPKGADAKVIVRIDHAALVRGVAEADEVCEIAGVGPVPVSTVREWMGDAFVAAVLTKGVEVAKVVHLGRKFTSVQRTALQWQDPCCARRGCGNRLGLELDHLEDWAKTHTTRSTSGKRFCKGCHRLKSAGWIVGPMGDDGKHDLSPPPEHRRPAQSQLTTDCHYDKVLS
jgi:hypothetical protein